MNKEFSVKFSLSEMTNDFDFEKLAHKHKAYIFELDGDGLPTETKNPIRENIYIIEYDGRDPFSMAGCAWIAGCLLDNGYRVFAAKNKFYASTSLSKTEFKKLIDELSEKVYLDDEFWELAKYYELFLKMRNAWVDNLKSDEVSAG